jgi:subtilisin-like proprotein convertase family protein
MRYKLTLICLAASAAAFAQTFSGSTGGVTDDGVANDFTAVVSGLSPATLDATHGLVTVCFDITHSYDSDLNIHLVAPDGTEINLVSGVGGGDDNFSGTCFNQTAPSVINTGTAPFTGTWKPQETLGNMNNGQNGNGLWKLRITDTYPADVGIVNSWSITFGPGASTPIVFSSSNLPIIKINTGGASIPNEPKINATMGIIYNGPGVINNVTDPSNNYNGNIGIEIRGSFSSGLPQKPYNIETRDASFLESDASLLGLPAEHDWCLIANYNDKVFMRNTLAYGLFDDMGHYSIRNRYCEVILNGTYQGIYLLTESIKRDNNRVNVAKLETTENTGIDVTGGYIIKNDYWDMSDSWLLNYHPIDHPTFDVRLVYEYPKPANITAQQKTYIQGFVNDFESALYSPAFADPVNGYRKYMSETSFLDYLIVNELARNGDGFKKSSYFHKDINPATTIAKLKAGPVWDFDWAWKDIWGCSISEATDGSGWAHEVNDCSPDVNSPGWYVRMMQDTTFQNNLKCRWENFRLTILSDSALYNYVDSVALYLNAAQARHFERWGNLGVNTGSPEVQNDPGTFSANITLFKNWISLRLAWLDANMPGNLNGCSFVGIEEQEGEAKMALYPNPAKDLISISLHDNFADADVQIFDAQGKLVIKLKMGTNSQIDIHELPEGVYYCRIATTNSVHSEKFVVIR